MMIIGCDLHTRFQQIAMLDTETGEDRRWKKPSGPPWNKHRKGSPSRRHSQVAPVK